MHYGFAEPGASVIDNDKRLVPADMVDLPGSAGTLEKKFVDRKWELLAGKWAQQQLHMIMDNMAWAQQAVVASFGEISLYRHICHWSLPPSFVNLWEISWHCC